MKRIIGILLPTFVLLMSCVCGSAFADVEDTVSKGTSEFGTIEVERGDDEDAYYGELLAAEKYNYKVLRNLSGAFDADDYEQYITAVELAIRGNRLNDTQRERLDSALTIRQNMVPVRSREDTMWMLWGDVVPQSDHSVELDFTDCYDNADFKPFLVPFMLEEQSAVKGNLIVIAGGGYAGRNNKTEGYPIADTFNALGYNCYVLQRRVAPYAPADTWLDLQRAIRIVKYEVETRGLGGADCIAAAGFSGGSSTLLGCVAYYYGDIQPSDTDTRYIPDEIDAYNADLDVALCIYGPMYDYSQSGHYEGLVTENDHLPAMFLVAGLMDNTGAQHDNLTLAASVEEKTLLEYHAFANTPHGFGVGTEGTNSLYWAAMADGFMEQAVAAKQSEDKA